MTDNEKKKARKRITIVSKYREVFGSPMGHEILQDLVNEHFIINSTFSKDPMEMAMREGERNVILRILKKMNVNPKMILERIQEIEREAQE